VNDQNIGTVSELHGPKAVAMAVKPIGCRRKRRRLPVERRRALRALASGNAAARSSTG